MPSTKRVLSAQINDRQITVELGETLLQAALRQGLDFPNSCRVGGCGTCKCRLTSGDVRELTETGYLLTAEEIDQRYILACQSVPRSDVGVAVDLGSGPAARGLAGRVIGQKPVTHDIVRLDVQLDESIAYRAGQFATLAIDRLEGVTRTYSFATPSRDDGRVSFFVRKVPGGRFSSVVNDEDIVGAAVRVDGPSGDFWMRPGDGPLLLVAGGSGLAPILAILQEALAAGVRRPVTLLFGAREARDLYAIDEIESIARRWGGPFRFVPVLSSAQDDRTWTGERGLVTDKIADLVEPGSHALLCGPPAMIDGAIARLLEHGVRREHVHFDRFTTQADAAAPVEAANAQDARAVATLRDYLKYFAFHAIGVLAAAALVLGGKFLTLGLLGVVGIYVIGDAVGGDDTSTPRFRHPGVLTTQLWMALPLLSLIVFCAVWSMSAGDPFGFGAWVSRLGYDVLAARDATTFGQRISTWIITGLMIGLVGTIPAHELTHRTWDPISMFVGRWLLAFSFDTTFAIEHVHGHHRYVATLHDPATAPRGRNVYVHIVASTLKGNVSAWRIEADRLRKKHLGRFSVHNAFLRGHAMSLVLVIAAFAMGGWRGGAFFVACALWGKSLLEIVNYMEHYGIVRNPKTPVMPRHSWNTNRRVSSWAMFNLTRHSHHHAQGELPYQELRPYPDAPMMISGYLTTIILAMIPPVWHRIMTPRVLAWDRDYATPEERRLAAAANERSQRFVAQSGPADAY